MKKILPLLLAASLFVGCATILPGNDPVVVNAERTTSLSIDTFSTFLHLEYDHRDALKGISPAIHKYAEYVRVNEHNWIATARAETLAYKHNRTADNKASLDTAVAVLTTAMAETQRYTTVVSTSIVTP